VPSVRKVVGSTPPLAATQEPRESPSPVIACMTDVAPCGCLASKFDSCNSLLSSVHTLLVNILRYVRLYTKRKYYYYYAVKLLKASKVGSKRLQTSCVYYLRS